MSAPAALPHGWHHDLQHAPAVTPPRHRASAPRVVSATPGPHASPAGPVRGSRNRRHHRALALADAAQRVGMDLARLLGGLTIGLALAAAALSASGGA